MSTLAEFSIFHESAERATLAALLLDLELLLPPGETKESTTISILVSHECDYTGSQKSKSEKDNLVSKVATTSKKWIDKHSEYAFKVFKDP